MEKIAGKVLAGITTTALGLYIYGDYAGFWGDSIEREVFSGQTKSPASETALPME